MLGRRMVQRRVARVGFDWEEMAPVLDKVEEELGELRQAVEAEQSEAVREEIGDLLFTVVMLARQLKVDPESALEKTNLKFRRRFAWMEQELGRRNTPLDGAGAELLEQLWNESKSALESASGP